MAAAGTDLLDSFLTRAEVLYSLEEEMVMTVEDLLDRRTSASLFTPDNGLGVLEQVAHTIAAHLGWDKERAQREAEAYRTLVQEMKAFVRC
jgi:glycerol-3-phosphate dehydrogenase